MTINELISNISNKDFNMEKELQVKKYLPIEEKKMIAKGIIYECTEKVNGTIKVDSLQRYLSYVKYMIVRHTNLEYTSDNYDELCSSGLLNTIMECFGDDAQECSRVLDLMMDDYMQEASIEFAVSRFLDNLSVKVEELSIKLEDHIEKMNLPDVMPKGVDTNKLVNFLNTYVK